MRYKSPRILVTTQYFPPEMGAAAARLHGLTRWWQKRGLQVQIVTSMPNYPTGRIYPGYKDTLVKQERIDGLNVLRTWLYTRPHTSKLSRLLSYFSFVLTALYANLKMVKYFDVILVSSPPLFVGLVGYLCVRIRRKPWILDIRDLWPDIAVDMGELNPKGLAAKLAYRLEESLYQSASLLVPVTTAKKFKIRAKGVPEGRTTVVSNGIDLDKLEQVEKLDWKKSLSLDGKFVAVYAGLIGLAQGVHRIVDVAELLMEENQIHFLIMGEGVSRPEVEAQIEDRGLTNITLMKSRPQPEALSIIQSMDVALVPLLNKNIDDAVPSKLLEAWGLKKPVLLMAHGESAKLVAESKGGSVADPDDLQAILKALRHMFNNQEEYQDRGLNAYDFVIKYFDREQLASAYQDAICKLLERQGKYSGQKDKRVTSAR